METSLHRQLKQRYADEHAQIEVPLREFRIDAIAGDELIEIQHGSLAAIRDKIKKLCRKHRVRVVKPIVARKQLIKLDKKDGEVLSQRLSPKRGQPLDLFSELIYFTKAFPHRNLVLEFALVEVEEWRYPGHGKRRRRRDGDFQIADQKLVDVTETFELRTRGDLLAFLPEDLPSPFHTGHLAEGMKIDRWIAQRIAYCLRETGTTRLVGKQGNALLYKVKRRRKRAA